MTEEKVPVEEPQEMSQPQQPSLNGGLKRKNENGVEEQKIEAGIKRVALNDDSTPVMSTTSSPKQTGMVPEEVDDHQMDSDIMEQNNSNDSSGIANNQDILETTSSISADDSSVNISNHNDYIYLRMLCLVKEASVIVGSKGDTITQIKHNTNTKINVSSNLRDVPERVIFVKGSCENVSGAYYSISKHLIAHRNRKIHYPDETPSNGSAVSIISEDTEPEPFHSAIPSSAESLQSSNKSASLSKESLTDLAANAHDDSPSDDEDSTITLNMLIPHYLMGYVIGKNGSVLKEIEEESTVRLQASPHQLLPSTDRILRVTGSPKAIRIAVLSLAHIINSHRDKLRNKKTIFYQPGPIYSVLGKGQFSSQTRLISKSSSSSAVSLQYPISQPVMAPIRYRNGNNMESNYNNLNRRSASLPMVMLIPSIDSQGNTVMARPPTFVKVPTSSTTATSPPPDSNNNAVYTAETAANATTFVPQISLPNVRIVDTSMPIQPMAIVKQEVYIDENFVGNVIGKEGKHINSIKDTTGCSVIIEGPVEGASERKLVIEGTHMGAQAAIMLISNKIEMDKFNQNMQKK